MRTFRLLTVALGACLAVSVSEARNKSAGGVAQGEKGGTTVKAVQKQQQNMQKKKEIRQQQKRFE